MLNSKEYFTNELRKTWHQVFGVESLILIDDFERRLARNLKLPGRASCDVTGVQVSTTRPFRRLISEDARRRRAMNDGFMQEQQQIDSFDDIQRNIKAINLFAGEQVIQSELIYESSHIYSSDRIYKCSNVQSSRNSALSVYCSQVEHAFGCENLVSSKQVLCGYDSRGLNKCFQCFDCVDCSDSLFISDCSNLKDCLFCYHIDGKQFCVANMQYSENEYLRIKDLVIDHILGPDGIPEMHG